MLPKVPRDYGLELKHRAIEIFPPFAFPGHQKHGTKPTVSKDPKYK